MGHIYWSPLIDTNISKQEDKHWMQTYYCSQTIVWWHKGVAIIAFVWKRLCVDMSQTGVAPHALQGGGEGGGGGGAKVTVNNLTGLHSFKMPFIAIRVNKQTNKQKNKTNKQHLIVTMSAAQTACLRQPQRTIQRGKTRCILNVLGLHY